MNRNPILFTMLLVLLTSCVWGEELTVAAAADLNYVLKSLAGNFEQKTGNKVIVSFGASGNLFSQVKSGAPFDVFFSADTDYPQQLAAAGLGDPRSVTTYAIGHLVLWVPMASKLDPQGQKLDLLTRPDVQHIAIANPQHAPYGRAAMAALEKAGIKDRVTSKLVFGENVAQTAQFVQSGNAQAGLIALSLALSPPMKTAGKYWELPQSLYPEMRQAAIIVSASKHKNAAKAFLEYVTSADARAVLEQYGFRVPAGP